MKLFQNDKLSRASLIAGPCLYILLALFYFLWHEFHWFPGHLNLFKFLPLTLLTLMSLWMLPWQMGVAMLCAAFGDLFGEMKYVSDSDIWFMLQMGFFALGHLMIIAWFLSLAWKKRAASIKAARRAAKKSTAAKHARPDNGGSYAALMMLPPVAVAFAAAKWIIPCATHPLNICMTVYAAVIVIMWWCAAMQKDLLYFLGASLFVCSDFVLAWDMFTAEVTGATYIIMVTYYLAELLLFVRSSRYYENNISGKEFWHKVGK